MSVKNATGVNLAADAAFATGKALTFTDGTGNFTVNPFPGTTLEGTPVSKGAMNITGIATSAAAPGCGWRCSPTRRTSLPAQRVG